MPDNSATSDLHVVYSDQTGFGGHIIAVTRELKPELGQHMRQEFLCSTDDVWLVLQCGAAPSNWFAFEPTVLDVCATRQTAAARALDLAADWIAHFPTDWYLDHQPPPVLIEIDSPGNGVRYQR